MRSTPTTSGGRSVRFGWPTRTTTLRRALIPTGFRSRQDRRGSLLPGCAWRHQRRCSSRTHGLLWAGSVRLHRHVRSAAWGGAFVRHVRRRRARGVAEPNLRRTAFPVRPNRGRAVGPRSRRVRRRSVLDSAPRRPRHRRPMSGRSLPGSGAPDVRAAKGRRQPIVPPPPSARVMPDPRRRPSIERPPRPTERQPGAATP